MSLKTIDALLNKLLDISFKKEPDYSQINQLEFDVWRKIKQNKYANSTSLILPVWSNAQFRYASLTLALISGLIISQISFQPIEKDNNILGLDVFSSNAPFIITSTFNKQYMAIS